MLDKVSARNDSEPKGKVPEGSISAIREKSRGEKKTCSCHKTTNMPLKSFALSKCRRGGSTNNNNNNKKNAQQHVGRLVFFQWKYQVVSHKQSEQDRLKLTSCLAAIFKFISMTSIYFKIHHVLSRLRQTHVIPGKDNLVSSGDGGDGGRYWCKQSGPASNIHHASS